MKFTGENTKITYKQEFIKNNLIQKQYEIHGKVCKECERLQ